MKKLILLMIVFADVLALGAQTIQSNTGRSAFLLTKQQQEDHAATIQNQISLPWGSDYLKNHYKEFKYWENEDSPQKGSRNDLIEGRYLKVNDFYGKISQLKANDRLPPIESFEYLPLSKNQDFKINKKYLDSFTFKLPDIGPYSCYYLNYKRFYSLKMTTGLKFDQAVGFLVFYDPKNMTAKLLMINALYSGAAEVEKTCFFLIDTNKTVNLFQFDLDDNTGRHHKTVVNISALGQFIFKKIY